MWLGSGPPEFAADDTGFLLQWAHRRVRSAVNDALASMEIDVRHFGVLSVVAQLDAPTQRQLIETLDVDKSSMVTWLDHLERAGLVERKRVAGDRRAYAVHLTQDGQKRLDAATRVSSAVMTKLLEPFDAQERRHLNDMLWRLIRQAALQEQS